MKPLFSIVVAILVIAANAHPDNIEAVKQLNQTKEPEPQAQESVVQARKERCTACSGQTDIFAAIKNLPKGEVHTQQSFEGCSSEKGCAGIKVKDGKIIEKFGNLDAFKAAASADGSKEFQFLTSGSGVFNSKLSEDVPFWWMKKNSPFKTGGATFEKFTQQSSSFSSNGATDLSSNPFLNGEFSKLTGGFSSSDSNSYSASASFGSGAKNLDITKNPFLNGAFSGQSVFGSGAGQSAFSGAAGQSGFAGGATQSAFNSAGGQSGFAGGATQSAFNSAAGQSGFAGGATQSAFNSAANQNGFAVGASQNAFNSAASQSGFTGGASQNAFNSAAGQSGFGGGASQSAFNSAAAQNGFVGGASQNSFNSAAAQRGFAGGASQNSFNLAAAQSGFAGGASQNGLNSFSSSSKFGSGYTGSSPRPFTASTAGSNINLIQNTQKGSEYDFVQQQSPQSFDDIFQSSGNVQANENAGGNLQQTCSGQGYICVPRAQCNNGVVNANGGALLQANTQKQYCNVRSEICCRIETLSLAGAGNTQGSLGVGSATFNQGSSAFSTSNQNSKFGVSVGVGQAAGSGFANSAFGASNFKGTSIDSTLAPPRFGTTQSNFIDTDSFSAGSDISSVVRPGVTGLKPGIPYLPPLDATPSGSTVVSTGYPSTFVTTPRPFTTPRPVTTPRPFTTPRPYIPPVLSTSAPKYLPPTDPIIAEGTYSEGNLVLEQTIPGTPKFRPPVPPPSEIPVGCAAALKCTPIEFCTAEGIMSNTTVILTREQQAYRVPLTDCKDLETGRIGKCCRDPFYTDPWPTNQLGKWVPGVFGGNDGKYVPDTSVSSNNPRPQVTLRPETTASIIRSNILPRPTTPFTPNTVTPSFPASTPGSFIQQTQFGKGSFEQGGRGVVGIGGQGQVSIRGQGQYEQGSQGQFGQGSQLTQSVSQFGQRGVGQTVTQGTGSYGLVGRGEVGVNGQGQAVIQGQGTLVTQGTGTRVTHGQGFGIQQGQGVGVLQGTGQIVRQGGGQIVSQGGGFGVTKSQGFGGQGQGVIQGFGQSVSQGQGSIVTKGSGFGVTQEQGTILSQGGGVRVQEGQGQAVLQGAGFGVSTGQGQGVTQGFGIAGNRGQGAFITQGQGQGISRGQGQTVTQGQGFGVKQGFGYGVFQGTGQGVIRGSGQTLIQGQGQKLIQGFGTGIKTGGGFTVNQGGGEGIENNYSESVQRVFLQRYSGTGECGILNPRKPYGNHKEQEVDFAEIPWQAMVLLQTNRSLLCGGVITRPDVVVTSASCVEGLEAKNVLIKGGEWKLGIDDEPLPFQIVQVKHILRHPFYKAGAFKYDAAILVLTEDLRLAKNIWPICVPSASDTLDAFYNGAGECIVTGWGKQVLQAHLSGSIMHSINVSLINPGQCEAKLSQDYPHLLEQYDQESCVCGQPTNPLNNLCRVDIGSALACTTGDRHYVLHGIYSWDSGCQVGNQLAAFYKFDIEWYEWAIGFTESVRFAQFGKVTKGKITSVKTTTFTSGGKGSVTSGVKGITTKDFGVGGLGQFGQFTTYLKGISATQGFGVENQSQTGQINLKEFKGNEFGLQGQTGQFSTSQSSEIQGPLSKTFSTTYTEKKIFQSEPKFITYTTKPEIVTFTTKPKYFTYTTKPEIVTYTTKPEIVTYTTKPEIVTFTTKPKIVTYTTKPEIVTYTTKPEIVTYTTKPKYFTYTTKPQIIRYETSGSKSSPTYVAPGVNFKPSFSEIVSAKHTHDATCKCLQNTKK